MQNDQRGTNIWKCVYQKHKEEKKIKKWTYTVITVARHKYLCSVNKHQKDCDKAKIVVGGGEIVGNFAFFLRFLICVRFKY